jgi:iron complex outermembrane receptor protein
VIARATLLACAGLALLPGRSVAQQACSAPVAMQSWPAPLDRRIALRARDVSLREAIDRVAAAARFRVSYSAEFLPLDRHVCVVSDSVVAGDALADLLTGVSVAPVAIAADQVVIAPTRAATVAPRESLQTLERVVVTGSASGNAQRPLSVSVDVLDHNQFEQRSSGTLSSSFDGNVAGLWVWEQSPGSLLARYGSIRGASSFGISYPKVYIDGIEVANPLLLTDLNPASIDRVEVIRGPQGAALYGADAISGVVNIITRHEGLQAGASHGEVVSRAGLSQTEFAERSVLAQNHSLKWRAGSNMLSGSLGVNVTTLGGYVPEAFSRDVKVNGGFRLVSSSASVTGTGRVYAKRSAVGQNPLILSFLPSQAAPAMSVARNARALYASREDSLAQLALGDSMPQSVQQYTFGTTTTFLSGTNWVPSLTAGVDGYRLSNVPNDLGLIPSALDSLHSVGGGADRVSVRGALVGQYDLPSGRALTLTFAGEHSYLNERLTAHATTFSESGSGPGPSGSGVDSAFESKSIRRNTGFVGQANLALNDVAFLTGGVRLERNQGYTQLEQVVALPMLGAAAVHDLGRVTVKARAAYGVGVRPVRSTARGVAYGDLRDGPAGQIDPERQSGVEIGADVFYARRFALHLTRFDQTASGLIQPVAVPRDSIRASGTGTGPSKRITYVQQNVGEITNSGWELESSFDLGRFALGGAFTTVDSRVRQIARGYGGDLRPGDRMLAVPAGTASLSATMNVFGWRAGLTGSRAFDWINYDRLRLARDYASCESCVAESLTGQQLRSYWIKYDGVTRLRASLARELVRGVGFSLTADNLTNAQRGEPDNITVLPGRTVLVGLSAKIR